MKKIINNAKVEKKEIKNSLESKETKLDDINGSLDAETKDKEGKIKTQREIIAGFLAIGILAIFLFTILLPIIYFFINKEIPVQLKDYLSSIIPTMATLLGAAFGFYFSEKRF
jgi:hypothetical protein